MFSWLIIYIFCRNRIYYISKVFLLRLKPASQTLFKIYIEHLITTSSLQGSFVKHTLPLSGGCVVISCDDTVKRLTLRGSITHTRCAISFRLINIKHGIYLFHFYTVIRALQHSLHILSI